jgi:hypothetical protein
MALPVQIKLKNPSQFPHPKQYPLKPEDDEVLCLFLKTTRATN